MPANTQMKRYKGPRIDYPYATWIGKLLYAALGAHPDIAYAIQHLSQFTSNPGPEHIAGVKRVYHYLKGTIGSRITYSGNSTQHEPISYSDADWGQNILDRRSISGQVYMLAGGATSWVSKKQPTIAQSSLEGGYLALLLSVRHTRWLSQLYTYLGLQLSKPIGIFTDNTAAIASSHDPTFHARTKHIDVWHHFIRDTVAKKAVTIAHIPGIDNPTDILTKALPNPRFTRLQDILCGQSNPEKGSRGVLV